MASTPHELFEPAYRRDRAGAGGGHSPVHVLGCHHRATTSLGAERRGQLTWPAAGAYESKAGAGAALPHGRGVGAGAGGDRAAASRSAWRPRWAWQSPGCSSRCSPARTASTTPPAPLRARRPSPRSSCSTTSPRAHVAESAAAVKELRAQPDHLPAGRLLRRRRAGRLRQVHHGVLPQPGGAPRPSTGCCKSATA